MLACIVIVMYVFPMHHIERSTTLYFQLDAFSLFVDIVPAGDSTVTGLVTFLAAAEAIGKVKKQLVPVDKSIVFMLFNGVCVNCCQS